MRTWIRGHWYDRQTDEHKAWLLYRIGVTATWQARIPAPDFENAGNAFSEGVKTEEREAVALLTALRREQTPPHHTVPVAAPLPSEVRFTCPVCETDVAIPSAGWGETILVLMPCESEHWLEVTFHLPR